MKRLVALLEQYRPGIAETLVPAKESEIAKLLSFEPEMPGAHLRFLRTMGESAGDFLLEDGDGSLRIEGVVDLWRCTEPERRKRVLYIGQDNSPSCSDYFLDRTRPYARDDCMLVRMPLDSDFDPEQATRTFAGLEEFLYYEAYRAVRLPLLEHNTSFECPTDEALIKSSREQVFDLADQLGFRRIPPVEYCALYERGDAALLLYRVPLEQTFRFSLSCEDEAELARLAASFEEKTGVSRTTAYAD